ncbi:MAG TPA: hypothetical protein VKS60_08340, partial [Stellaceae bacterium]|nr:hypothetical protein [Stellaceae bacterium]
MAKGFGRLAIPSAAGLARFSIDSDRIRVGWVQYGAAELDGSSYRWEHDLMERAGTIIRLLAGTAAMLSLVDADAGQPAPQTAAAAVTVANPVTKPVPNQDVDSPLRNAYQQMNTASCSLAGSCTVFFPATTATMT